MTTITDISNWKLSIRQTDAGITVMRAVTCDRQAVLPESLFGKPVTALSHHALSDYPLRESAEEVLVTNGRIDDNAVWDDQRVQELWLPSGLLSAGDFAFLKCRQLETLHLYDDLQKWGGCSLRGCQNLRTVFLRSKGEEEKEGIILHTIISDLTQELDVVVDRPGQRLRVLFPGYEETYEEGFISQAVHFYYQIQGAGYPYHHCLLQKKLNLKIYDELWPAYMGMAHEENTALRLAWWRLRYPVDLTQGAEQAYLAYLQKHTRETLSWLLSEGDQAGLNLFLQWVRPEEESLKAACAQARKLNLTEALARLLEEQHRRFPLRRSRKFDL